MNRSLGRVFLTLLIFMHINLFASTYEWSATADKSSAYVNEAIHLKYVCSFSDRGELYTIDFHPMGEYENYTVELLKESEDLVDEKRVNSYEFVVFAKSAGEIRFDFKADMKKTTKDSIENTVIGRDNVEKEDFTKEIFKQKVLIVDVKETNSSIVGEFVIDVKRDKPEVKAYEPYHMLVTIKGRGNFESIKALNFNIDGVKVFAGEVEQKQKLDKSGKIGEWSQKFAFVSDKSFAVPELKIEYFTLKEQKIKKLVIDSTDVEVKEGFTKEELLDKVEDKSIKLDYSYLYYMLAFIAGFLVAKIKINKSIVKQSEDEEFVQKIKESKSLEELMVILIMKDSKKYDSLIVDIEQKRVISLKEAKKVLNI